SSFILPSSSFQKKTRREVDADGRTTKVPPPASTPRRARLIALAGSAEGRSAVAADTVDMYQLFHADRETVNPKIAPFFQIAKTGKPARESMYFPEQFCYRGAPILSERQEFLPGGSDFWPNIERNSPNFRWLAESIRKAVWRAAGVSRLDIQPVSG